MILRILTIALFLVACTLSVGGEPSAINEMPAQVADSAWEILAPGLEQRTFTLGGLLSQIVALRIDPEHYTFRVHYRPGEPLSVWGWSDILPGVQVLVNANFFDTSNEVLGLLVSDGVVYGHTLRNSGGTFAIQNGLPRIWSNIVQPYMDEPLEQAVQAQPMLVLDGEPAPIYGRDRVSRRTAIAQDSQRRIILLVTPLPSLTLRDLSDFLASSDMEVVNAFNLDGGRSTMMYVAAADYRLASIDPVPAVLAVYSHSEENQ